MSNSDFVFFFFGISFLLFFLTGNNNNTNNNNNNNNNKNSISKVCNGLNMSRFSAGSLPLPSYDGEARQHAGS